ncbi:MAG: DUF1735 domain-containing protein [Prevotella sp.]|nr:DUF1735 domain-containing protein [Prevotella sp.]
MKTNIVKCFSYCMLAVAALSFVSCSSNDSYDVYGNPDNLVYLDLRGPKTYESKLLSTPVGIFGMAGAFIPVHAQHATSGMASVEVVDSLVARYNRENKTEYPAFPAEALKALQITPAQFANNQKDTIQVNVPEDKYALFTEPTYVLPLVLSDVQGGKATEIEDYKVAYVLVNVSSTEDFISITGGQTVKCGIVKTPVGVFGGVSANFGASIKAAVATDWTSTLEVDNSLVASYNEAHNTEYAALPADALAALEITSNVIAKGQTSSTANIKVSLPDNIAQALDKSYIIPLRLKTTYGDKTYQEDNDVAYILIDVSESLINDDATEVKGTAVTGMTCIEAVNLNKDVFATSNWSFLQQSDNASFVVDLGATKNVSSILISSGAMNNAKIELSADNSSWKVVGNTSEHSGPSVGSGWYSYTAYVLYGAVSARYVRVTMSLDTNYWGWFYNYCRLDAFNVYAE